MRSMRPKSICDNCTKDCVWRAPTGGSDPPVTFCQDYQKKPKRNIELLFDMTEEQLADAIYYELSQFPDKASLLAWLKEACS